MRVVWRNIAGSSFRSAVVFLCALLMAGFAVSATLVGGGAETSLHLALERLGANAAESIYVGDNYWADVIGAQRAGVQPVLYDPHRLFPEADCPVLAQIDDLLAWLP